MLSALLLVLMAYYLVITARAQQQAATDDRRHTVPVAPAGRSAADRAPPSGGRGATVEQASWLATITWLYVAWSLVPVLIAVAFSFNKGRSRSSWQGFSLRWWCTDGRARCATTPRCCSPCATAWSSGWSPSSSSCPLGVALAIGLTRWRSRAANGANVIAAAARWSRPRS